MIKIRNLVEQFRPIQEEVVPYNNSNQQLWEEEDPLEDVHHPEPILHQLLIKFLQTRYLLQKINTASLINQHLTKVVFLLPLKRLAESEVRKFNTA